MADLFLAEILEQPAALAATADYWLDAQLARRLRQLPPRPSSLVVLTGMGSSLDACYPACVFLNRHRVRAVAVETAELLYYHPALLSPDSLLVVVSQSGESAEPVRLLADLDPACPVVSVTNGLENFVARRSALALDLRAGPELTVSTKTYVSTIVALLALSHHVAGVEIDDFAAEVRRTIAALEQFLGDWEAPVQALVRLAQSRAHLWLVGRGPSLATAEEGALILGEAAHRPAKAISGGHFRHGPLELVSEHSGYILFTGERRTRELVLGLGRDIARYGAGVAWVGPGAPVHAGFASLLLLEDLDPCLLPVLEIVPIQLLAWSLARLQGRTIDGFEKLQKVTRTE